MHADGGNVLEEELAIQDDVVAGQESLDPCVDGDAWFLPEQVGHDVVLLPESCRRGFSRELLLWPLPCLRRGGSKTIIPMECLRFPGNRRPGRSEGSQVGNKGSNKCK